MLVLSRRPDEKILLPSVPAVIKVIAANPGVVRLGIEAPEDVPILREELARLAPPASVSADAPANARQAARKRLHNAFLCLSMLRLQLAEADPVVRKTLDDREVEIRGLRRALSSALGGEAADVPQPV
jgi:carbon storage regulator CsrA